MKGFGWRAGWTLALVTGVALHAGVAAAAPIRNETLVASGSITYRWQGDLARGCAGSGVCDVSGELIARPLGGSQYVSFGGIDGANLSIDASSVVRVLRGGTHPGVCVDIPDETFSGLSLRLRSRTRTTATLETPPASGRCAGPLQSDLSGLTFSVTRSGGRRPSFSVRGVRRFAAGPFSGTAIANLSLRTAPSQGSSQSSSSGGGSSGSSRILVELAQLSYRVAASSSTIQTSFQGTGDGTCQIVDSCGADGTLSFSATPAGGFSVFASRTVRRQFARPQVLADFRRGRLTANGFGSAAGTVSETYDWAAGMSCHDSASTPALQLVLGSGNGPGAQGSRIPVALMANTGPGIETLRTHCPGPADADLLGPSQSQTVVATGSLTTSQLLSRHITLVLSEPSSFAGLGYTGTRQGQIQLELTLTKLSAGTSR